jgi:hypothetical protein
MMNVAGQPSTQQEFIEIQNIKKIFLIKDIIRNIIQRQKMIEKELVENF